MVCMCCGDAVSVDKPHPVKAEQALKSFYWREQRRAEQRVGASDVALPSNHHWSASCLPIPGQTAVVRLPPPPPPALESQQQRSVSSGLLLCLLDLTTIQRYRESVAVWVLKGSFAPWARFMVSSLH